MPLAARGLPGVQVVRTVNGRGWLYSSHSPLALTLRPIYRALHRLAARSTAATVFEIHDDQTYFDSHRMTGTRGGRVIPGAGTDVEGFERALAAAPPPAQLRDELGLGTSEVVMTVTRMTREKGIPTLLKAAALTHKVRPNVQFVLVGPRESEGPLSVSQAELDSHAPYVVATGPRSDVAALLRIADVFAFPSEYREGVPRALCEAALAGVPTVATSMPGCCEVITDGVNGFVVPPGSPLLLAEKILAVPGRSGPPAPCGPRRRTGPAGIRFDSHRRRSRCALPGTDRQRRPGSGGSESFRSLRCIRPCRVSWSVRYSRGITMPHPEIETASAPLLEPRASASPNGGPF